jgi:hypothetical protein
MMRVAANTIIDLAATQLLDIFSIRWSRDELLNWVSDAQNQIVLLSPSASSTSEKIALVEGTRQDLPGNAWVLLDVYRNWSLGIAGRAPAPGRAVRMISRSVLDRFSPTWHTDTKRQEVINYIYDIQDPKVFWVYPPNNGKGVLEVNYSAMPKPLINEDDELEVLSVYRTAVLDYVLFRACSKDAEYAPGQALAQSYYMAFMASVMGKTSSEDANTPLLSNSNSSRGTPT